MRLRFLPILSAAALLAVGFASARADVITVRSGTVTAVTGGYDYTYSAQLTGGSQLDPVLGGAPVQFGTVYDFGPSTFVGSTGLLATQFTFTFDLTDPAASLTAPTDDPTLQNIRFTYDGTTGAYAIGQTNNTGSTSAIAVDPAIIDNLGTFTVFSSLGPGTRPVTYDGQSYKESNNTVQGNAGYTVAPALSPVPEPSSLALLGTGLLGVVSIARRRIKA